MGTSVKGVPNDVRIPLCAGSRPKDIHLLPLDDNFSTTRPPGVVNPAGLADVLHEDGVSSGAVNEEKKSM